MIVSDCEYVVVSECLCVVVSDSMCAGETVLCISVYFVSVRMYVCVLCFVCYQKIMCVESVYVCMAF